MNTTPDNPRSDKARFLCNGFWVVSFDDSCRLEQENARLLEALEGAYLGLLLVPHSSPARLANQCAMVGCVDAIAKITGREREEVQNEFEARAALRTQP